MPFGVVGYLSGKVVRIPLSTIVQVLILLVPGLFLFDGLASTGVDGWFTFLWVLALGLLATLPLGLLLGGLVSNPRVVAQTVGVGSAAVIAISGGSSSRPWCCDGWRAACPEPPWKRVGRRPPRGSAQRIGPEDRPRGSAQRVG